MTFDLHLSMAFPKQTSEGAESCVRHAACGSGRELAGVGDAPPGAMLGGAPDAARPRRRSDAAAYCSCSIITSTLASASKSLGPLDLKVGDQLIWIHAV